MRSTIRSYLYSSIIDAGRTIPGSLEGVLAIGASNHISERAHFSNFGKDVLLNAPGTDITSTYPKYGGYLKHSNNTNWAACYVASLAGMLKAIEPTLNPESIKDIMVSTGDSIKNDPKKPIGHRINAYKAIKEAHTYIDNRR